MLSMRSGPKGTASTERIENMGADPKNMATVILHTNENTGKVKFAEPDDPVENGWFKLELEVEPVVARWIESLMIQRGVEPDLLPRIEQIIFAFDEAFGNAVAARMAPTVMIPGSETQH